ncbi:MAG: LON peptidase substrate-binding domain-containing protein [Pseudomonadota bacterium]|nr:LON peptidase substrate-binding domain-containing protein [Pseudomonadota bacterium]
MVLRMQGRTELPLFPLGNVLFCGGRLPLQIFEPRYIDMISACTRSNTGFGIVLIRQGNEVRTDKDEQAPSVFDVGTYASIVDFNPLPNGRLGIISEGGPKFRVCRTWEKDDRLLMGEVEFLPEENAAEIGEQFQPLVVILRRLAEDPIIQRLGLEIDFTDARSVSWRLAELLPVDPETKQSLLQMQIPRERLAEIKRLVAKLQGSSR